MDGEVIFSLFTKGVDSLPPIFPFAKGGQNTRKWLEEFSLEIGLKTIMAARNLTGTVAKSPRQNCTTRRALSRWISNRISFLRNGLYLGAISGREKPVEPSLASHWRFGSS